ncbi:MAG: TonB-dependent receptor domain-containing protein [Planctomycetota bacterium]
MRWRRLWGGVIAVLCALSAAAFAQDAPVPAGSVRGVVYDQDFNAPLPEARVLIVETGQSVMTAERGNYVFGQVPAGRYTLVFSKDGYVRQVKADVVVTAGQLTDVDVWLAGEFTEMDEFVVQDLLAFGTGSEAALLELRFESPSFMDSISSELMSRAGAGDAASALRLVAGASVQDGKFAVIRGLPDRYVSSQMNGVRLPSADEDKRAVQLDQFPSAIIESIQVSKTFTPDQQGDASGGAVNVRLKGIPSEDLLQLKADVSYNDQVGQGNDFLSFKGSPLNTWGKAGSGLDNPLAPLGAGWPGTVGVSRDGAPQDGKFSIAAGSKQDIGGGVEIGGLASFFYERDSSYFEGGTNDSYWVDGVGKPLTPEKSQQSGATDFLTSLYDVTQGSESVQWGGLGTAGIASEDHSLNLTYLYTRVAETTATLAEDTRGKEYFVQEFFGVDYNPDDPMGPGNGPDDLELAPYLRTETLEYTERTTGTLQLHGEHTLPVDAFGIGEWFSFQEPKLDWTIADSSADLYQPDKRQFGAEWHADSFKPGIPFLGIPDETTPANYIPFKPAANFNLGNLQRIWKDIEEESNQYSVNVKLPFEQWGREEGYLKFGVFDDRVDRNFNQDTFSNFGDGGATFVGEFDQFWSEVFPFEPGHPITASTRDVDYTGRQDLSAWYGMFDLPLDSKWTLIGGARFEDTQIGIVNKPEADATWFPPGSLTDVKLNPGDADVNFEQDDKLPSLGLVYEPVDGLTFRSAYSRTVARQTFKELTPILQQEFLGGPVFVGNPGLKMSALTNYDLRVDYEPYEGGLISGSWFKKDVEDPIEYVQKVTTSFTFTTPENYPKGQLEGYEFEVRQDLGHYFEDLDGLAVGVNATLIDSQVELPATEVLGFQLPNIKQNIVSRDMTNAPEHLYNLYLTYELPGIDSQIALFYTLTGDTLVAGAGQANGNFVPDVYAQEYGTLNLSFSRKLSERTSLMFQAKNLTNESIKEVYKLAGGDLAKTSYKKGREFSLGLTVRF